MWRTSLALLLLAGRAAGALPASNGASATVPRLRARALLPPVEGPAGAPLIVLDAGHGGRDPGSTGADGTHEKAITLELALATRAALLQGGHIRVALVRDSDRSIALADRREIARSLDAALLLSIHCDSTPDKRVRGASIYTLTGMASDAAARDTAARENGADRRIGPSAPVQDNDLPAILTGLAMRETQADADAFAADLGLALKPLKLLKPDFRHAAALRVLRAPDVPSVLFEAGYLSNRGDLRRLAAPRSRAALAGAIASAVRHYLTRQR